MSMFDTPADMTALLLRLRRRAQRLGAQTGDAEDMAQETVLRLMQRMRRTKVDAPEHYAMVILHNLARARWRALGVEMVELDEDDATIDPVADSRLALADLQRAISALPAGQAQIMQLVMQGEFSPASIAKQLDLPQGTVMSRLARARVKLRAHIGMETDTPVAELL
ncbi:sigma-70 family RNA polymerase sigma factor [Sulfitobacter sp. F26169L]|uniref:RNA polymerase sigma factor n=1 Tax=Sulfitobacter sp. F26169L TaxID=2996015 RepID=UPI002260E0E2|nr:sigma-70 family RNA polymerase sigma factor [Sulfitobacter sp. F26169L]MCX7566127.1 sigma-70 family RNA polymerase sigma factor [Sulfitobacter sp. F26169L]